MNDNRPTDDGFHRPPGESYGAESTSEPTRPVPGVGAGGAEEDSSQGFGRPQPHQPGYHAGGYGWQGYGYADYPPPGEQPGYGPRDQAVGQPTGAAAATPVPRPRRRGGLVVGSLALAALIGAGAGIGSYAYLDHGSGGTTTSPVTVTTHQADQQAKTNGTVEAAAKAIEPSVVTITVQTGSGGDIGSGVVLDKQGHILTNDHVVSAAVQNQGGIPGGSRARITVTFSTGRTATARIVGTDETDDLAVIKVNGVTGLKPASFAKSSSLSVGQSVVAVGAPLGLSQTVTSGIVSNAARPVRSGQNNDAVYMAVQTDAAINPGNSGGPLVDLDGSVVGINSSIASTAEQTSGSQAGNIGIGFAIPSDVAVRIASELIDHGSSADAVLGVTISATDNGSLGSTTAGVALQKVRPGSAAAKAGLRAGDVVTALNRFRVTTADGLIAATHYYPPGTTVTVTYQRGGSSHTTRATLGSA